LSSCAFSLRGLRFDKTRDACSLRRRESGTSLLRFVLPKTRNTFSVRPRGSGDPDLETFECVALGPRLRGDERRMLLRTHSHIQLSNSVALRWLAESQKNIGPCLRLWARGSPSFLSSVSLAGRGGRRADKAHDPGSPYELAWIGPGMRGSRASPDRRALGVKRHAPRLAARQRGILAFMPLTVVGPGRVVVPDAAARVRPGDGGCVRPSLAGAAPAPRRQDAS
jgi:hypothetical protein